MQNFCISLPVVLTVFRIPSFLPAFLPSLSLFSLGNALFKNCPEIKDKESLWKHSRLKKTKRTSPSGQSWFSTVWASQVAQMVKNLPAMQETWVQSLGQEDPLEKGMATHSSIFAWRIPWTEEPVGLQSMESQRVR